MFHWKLSTNTVVLMYWGHIQEPSLKCIIHGVHMHTYVHAMVPMWRPEDGFQKPVNSLLPPCGSQGYGSGVVASTFTHWLLRATFYSVYIIEPD